MEHEIGFEMAASNIRFGRGITAEIGMDLKDLGVKKTMFLTDPNIARLPMKDTVIDSLDRDGVDYVVYDRVRVEPTDTSFKDAIAFAIDHKVDSFVALGGGSVSHSASMAASLAGWVSETCTPCISPVAATTIEATSPKIRAILKDFVAKATCCFLRRW